LSALARTARRTGLLAVLFLDLHGKGHIVGEIYWGLWLLPFGVLVVRSGFLPRLLGRWLMPNGLAYVALSLTGLLLPDHYQALFPVLVPALLGEMAIMLWLLIVGVREQESGASAAPA
jgi:Domain of unknown function (DUF4386)